jgi:hypothetical protein
VCERGRDRNDSEKAFMTERPKASGQWLRDLCSKTSGKVRVHLSCEHLVTLPVEVLVGNYPSFVSSEMLGISDSLASDLTEFQSWWQAHTSFSGDEEEPDMDTQTERVERRQWAQSGKVLLDRLQWELGEDCEVYWI